VTGGTRVAWQRDAGVLQSELRAPLTEIDQFG
jgi:hypothetical protein